MRSKILHLVCVAMSTALAGPGFAADSEPLAASIADQPDWSGVYGGVIGGYSHALSSQDGIGYEYHSGDYPISGGLAGANFGFNYQFGKWVIGLESELSAARISGTRAPNFSSNLDSVFNVRARFGYSYGNFMTYLGLGPAYGRLSTSETFPGAPLISTSQIRSGWIFALGTEYMITPSLTARAEYMYICFGASIVQNSNNVGLMGHYARIGLDYKFDVPGLKREGAANDAESKGGPYNWGGFYFGPSIGGSTARTNTAYSLNNAQIGGINNDSAGAIVGFGLQGTVGAEAGANWQIGQYVIGAETDFHFSQLTGAGTHPRFSASQGGVLGTLSQIDTIGKQGTFRARFGLALDRWLIYGTAGLAYAEFDSDSTFFIPGNTVSSKLDSTRIGPVAGIGVERAIWGHWTTRLEYMYANFGAADFSFNGPAPFNVIGSKVDVHEHILRAGFNLMFN
jgi:outer membrane immunogenic protein